MPPVPVIAPAANPVPAPDTPCNVAECSRVAAVTRQVARGGIIFDERWLGGENVDLCRAHDRRALAMTGAEDYIDT
ncbi:hypothetical protein ABT023_16190 [Micromonospora sp. NPDC002296]|uniref:hypothetical protein n=1 Tax=Micromonospora sp. NPDC002296 TaxID=3154271 RepID=UPI00331A5E02